MRAHIPASALAPAFAILLALSGCAGGGGYPSLAPRPGEAPRMIEAPGAETTAALLPEQQASLMADLAQEGEALAGVESDMKRLGAELDKALATARGQSIGSEGWSNAQMALSRYDQARAPLDAISARLVSLARMVDSLPDTDADRQAVESLAARTASLSAQAEVRVAAANSALGL